MPVAPSPPASTARPTTSLPGQAMLVLSALYVLSRFTGLLQRIIIGALLPATATDAYSIAFNLPDILNYLVAGGAISLTFIPTFTRLWDKGKEAEAWRFFSSLICIMGAILLGATALMMWFAPALTDLLQPGLLHPVADEITGIVPAVKQETFDLAVQMTRVILPAQIFFYLGGLMLGVLNTFRRFGSTGWTGPVNNFIAIVVAVGLWFATKNPVVFAWSILLGAFIGNFLLPLLSLQGGPRSQRPRFRLRFDVGNPAVRRFFILTLPIMLGVSLPVVDWMVVVGYFGVEPARRARSPIMQNGNRLMIAAQGIIGQSVAVATFPFLASMVAAGKYSEFSEFSARQFAPSHFS